MIAVQIILIAVGTLLADAHECNCDCGRNNVCDEQTALRTELDENKAEITKWNTHYSFVESFAKDWQNQVSQVVRNEMVEIHETIEEVKNALAASQADVSKQMEAQMARIESLENSLFTLYKRADKLDVNMQNISGEMSAIKAKCQEIQDEPKCGVVDDNAGGSAGSGHVWPWTAAVYKNGNQIACYGSVIDRYFVLTTSWCPFYSGDAGLTVKLGDLKNGAHVQEYKVRSFHIHPKFRAGPGKHDNLDYDIGLLELEEPISFGPFVSPVCLPPRETTHVEASYQPPSAAKAADLESSIQPSHAESPMENLAILSQEKCRYEINRRGWGTMYFHTPEFSFCAESPATCPSRGSPVVQSSLTRHGTRKWTQVSVSILCTDNIIFGYRLARLMPWVEAIIEPASKQ